MRLSSLLSRLVWVGVVSSLGVLGPLGCTSEPMVVQMPCPPPPKPAAPPSAAKVETNETRTLDLRLAPSRDGGSAVASIDVTMRYSVPPVDFGDARPLVLGLGVGNGDSLEDVSARDSEGALSLARGGADETTKTNTALWHAERRARGPVTVTYRVKLPAAAAQDVASFAGGFLALGRAFLLLPTTTELYAIRVTWDLANLEEGSRGATSLEGIGAEKLEPPSSLAEAIWTAGPLQQLLFDSSTAPQHASLQTTVIGEGNRLVDVLAVGPFASGVWRNVTFSTHAGPWGHFDLFVRTNGHRGERFEVSLLGRAAIVEADEHATFGWQEKRKLARELVRPLSGMSIEGRRVYDEGFMAYYALDTMLRASLASPADVLAEISARSERYFSSPLAHAPASALDNPGDAKALAQAEDRGFLFAAELDERTKDSTARKRSLNDLIRGVSRQPGPAEPEQQAKRIPLDLLGEAVKKELGAQVEARYKAIMIDGNGTPEPAEYTFGPCFKKVKKKVPRYDLGLDPASATVMRVKGLSPKSPAAKAGLKDDEPIESLDLGDGTTDKPVKIVVRRKDSTATITYFPRGEPVEGFSWAFSEKAPASCGVPKSK